MTTSVPRHVAIIMDGNGRWATGRGVPRGQGHEAGAESVRVVVRECRKRGVEALTLYSFSTENWKRPPEEVSALMTLLKRYVLQERQELMEQGIRVRAIGQMSRLPLFVRKPLDKLVNDSAGNGGMTLNLALSYGSRAEMVDAVRQVARDAVAGRIDPDAITESVISDRLYTAGLPDPDLLIRTSGEPGSQTSCCGSSRTPKSTSPIPTGQISVSLSWTPRSWPMLAAVVGSERPTPK